MIVVSIGFGTLVDGSLNRRKKGETRPMVPFNTTWDRTFFLRRNDCLRRSFVATVKPCVYHPQAGKKRTYNEESIHTSTVAENVLPIVWGNVSRRSSGVGANVNNYFHGECQQLGSSQFVTKELFSRASLVPLSAEQGAFSERPFGFWVNAGGKLVSGRSVWKPQEAVCESLPVLRI